MKKLILIICSYILFALLASVLCSALIGNIPLLLEGAERAFIIRRGLLFFINIFPAVVCAGFLVAMSIFLEFESEKAQMRFSPIIAKHFKIVIMISVISVCVLTVCEEVCKPILKDKQIKAESAPHLSAEYIQTAKQMLEAENYPLVHRYAVQALKISPTNKEAADLLDKANAVLKAIAVPPEFENISASEIVQFTEAENETTASLLAKAREAQAQENWFQAHYYSQLAVTTANPKDLTIDEAQRIATFTWNKINSVPENRKTEEQEIFALKRDAYKSFTEKDNIEAYYKFSAIAESSKANAEDPDVKKFLDLSTERIKNQSFFIDETETLQKFENYTNTYFKIVRPNGNTDVIFIRGITCMENAGDTIQYLREFSMYTYSAEGKFICSIFTPYAKLTSYPVSESLLSERTIRDSGIKKEYKHVPYIILESIDRKMSEKRNIPIFKYANEDSQNIAAQANFLILPIPTEDFNVLCEISSGTDRLNLFTLAKLKNKASAYGFAPEIYGAAFIERVLYPFILLALLIFLAVLAWNYRINSNLIFKFKWAGIFPLTTLALQIIIQMILTAQNLINYALIATSSALALPIAICFYVILIIIASVTFLARKTYE